MQYKHHLHFPSLHLRGAEGEQVVGDVMNLTIGTGTQYDNTKPN